MELKRIRYLFKALRKDMLKSNWRIEIHRFYLKKPTLEFINNITEFYNENPNGKLRPIGAPNGISRVKSAMALDALHLFGLKTVE